MSKIEIVIIILLLLMVILGFKGCSEANEYIQQNGLRGVAGQLWCGKNGCKDD